MHRKTAAALVAAALLTPTAVAHATETAEPQRQYVLALWNAEKYPQPLVAWVVLNEPSLSHLDSKAGCGDWQADLMDYTTPDEVAAVDALIVDASLSPREDFALLAWDTMARPYKVWTVTDGCKPTPEQPPVVTPPTDTPPAAPPAVVTPPAAAQPPATPVAAPPVVTPQTPKDLSRLSNDERAGVETFARAHGIAPEAVLVEMG